MSIYLSTELKRTNLINILLDFEKTAQLYQKISQQKAWEQTPKYFTYNGGQAFF
jgi:hypothetical protein